VALWIVANDKAINLHRWLRWGVLDNEPLCFVESEKVRKNTSLMPITRKTYRKYLKGMQIKVRSIIKAKITALGTFGIAMDGWTAGTEHYLAQFAQGVLAGWESGRIPTRLRCPRRC
jgi:hypothetical protein